MTTPTDNTDNTPFLQPQLPPHTLCCMCGKELNNHTYGAAYYKGQWYCLACFARGKPK